MKVALQGIATVALMFAVWFALSQVNWIEIFKVNETRTGLDQEIGDLMWESISKTSDTVSEKQMYEPLERILKKICKANNIDRKSLKVHLVHNSEINAFAMPGRHLVIYTGLLTAVEKENEMDGVICHEIAHLELKHVMKKLMTEIGIGALTSASGTRGGGAASKEILKSLTSLAYSRDLEKEADLRAVDYMVEAGVDPEGLADFLYLISEKEPELISKLSWISSHPAGKSRVEYITDYCPKTLKGKTSLLGEEEWKAYKKVIRVVCE